eukprot:4007828-Pleurochrysis_carterae.AAC.3
MRRASPSVNTWRGRPALQADLSFPRLTNSGASVSRWSFTLTASATQLMSHRPDRENTLTTACTVSQASISSSHRPRVARAPNASIERFYPLLSLAGIGGSVPAIPATKGFCSSLLMSKRFYPAA